MLGAGMSGLAAARALARAGRRPLVLEAGDRPGGAMETAAWGGFLAELGPNTVQEAPALLELAAAAGCAGELIPAAAAAGRRFVVHRGRLVALPGGPRGLLATPLLSWRGKARLATEPWRRRGPGPHESLAAFFGRRLGSETLPLADAIGLGVFAGDPEELAVGYAFSRAYSLEREHGSLVRGMLHAARRGSRAAGGHPRASRRLIAYRGGFAELGRRLAEGLDVRYGCAALQAIRDGGGFRVLASRGERRLLLAAPRLVSALPAAATAAVLAPLAGVGSGFSATAAAGGPGSAAPGGAAAGAEGLAAIARIPHAPVAVVALGYERGQVLHPLDGFGFLAPHREERQILGCLFSSSLFPERAPGGRVLLTVMAGGRRRAPLVELPDAELVGLAHRELAELLGARGQPEPALVRRWQPGIPQPDARWPDARQAASALERAHPGLTILGNWLHGVGLPDCARAGWEMPI
ncbi:MAG: protoporphyrinogen oxidase [Acidobacteria bacterium]|nr:protoporphyrinogen oxidase [Acidobacteriota bacterium]